MHLFGHRFCLMWVEPNERFSQYFGHDLIIWQLGRLLVMVAP